MMIIMMMMMIMMMTMMMIITNDNDDDVHLSWVGDQGAVAGGAVPVEALEAVTRVAGVALAPAWPQCAVTPAAE